MTESTDQEFTDGLSPRVVHHDPRLPSQHTLDARQLRLLHRAIDTLAFTAESWLRSGDRMLVRVEPQPTFIESSGRWHWPLPENARSPGCSDSVVTASREWWEYAPSEAKPHPMAEGVRLRDGVWYWAVPGVAELIDATTSAWQPLMSELIEQQDRFRRGD